MEIFPMYEENAVRIEFFGDEIERISTLVPLTGEVLREEDEIYVFPATHYSAGPERMERAITGIEAELAIRLQDLEAQNKLLDSCISQRPRQRCSLGWPRPAGDASPARPSGAPRQADDAPIQRHRYSRRTLLMSTAHV